MTGIFSQRLANLRGLFKEQELDGFLVPHTDEFQSEYLPPSAERLAWLTGFTGSAGAGVVLMDKACVMSDGRYTVQIREQVDAALFEIANSLETSPAEWLALHARSGMVIGYDPTLHTKKQMDVLFDKLGAVGVTLRPLVQNPIDALWTDRPAAARGVTELFPESIAGRSAFDKVTVIAARLKAENLQSVVITLADSVCWLLNVRGDDIPYNPVVLSRVIVHADSRVDWFVESEKVTDEVAAALSAFCRIHEPSQFEGALAYLTGSVQMDFQRSSYNVFLALQKAGLDIVDGKDPCIAPKSIKAEAEQLALRQAHIRDGVAIVRLMYWLYLQNIPRDVVTEQMVEEKLEEFRRGDPTYRGPSFHTICGWAEHGAIVHYSSTAQSNALIKGDGFLLLDSGGQYEYGTTDITRTLVVGVVNDAMKDHYTRVLKGHIALATARFDDTAVGSDLDKLARAPLQEVGLDYAHSTGHGVGCYLCVHEESSTISSRGQGTYKAGMLLSNEPGYYRDGQYGIRLENLILCQENPEGGLYFDTVTVAPFDLHGVKWDMLTAAEYHWLAMYHRFVYDTLTPFLNEIEPEWLKTFLLPLSEEEPISA